jgi:hypothetical protein
MKFSNAELLVTPPNPSPGFTGHSPGSDAGQQRRVGRDHHARCLIHQLFTGGRYVEEGLDY